MKSFQLLNKILSNFDAMFNLPNWILMITSAFLTGVDEFITTNKWIEDGYNLLIPVSIGLMLMFCLVSLVEQTLIREGSPEDIVRMFIKFLIGAMFIKNGYKLLIGIIDFGTEIADFLILNANYNRVVDRTVADLNLIEIFLKIFELSGTISTMILVSVIIIFIMMSQWRILDLMIDGLTLFFLRIKCIKSAMYKVKN